MATADNSRFPTLDEAEMTDAQRAAWAAIQGFALNARGGHFNAMLRVPETTPALMQLGAYIRHQTGLPEKLIELAILVHARYRGDAYEWNAHRPRALAQGWSEDAVAALAEGRRPDAMTGDEAAVMDLCLEILRRNRVADDVFARARAALGEKGVVDFALLLGNYATVSALLAVADVTPPADAESPLPPMAAPFAD